MIVSANNVQGAFERWRERIEMTIKSDGITYGISREYETADRRCGEMKNVISTLSLGDGRNLLLGFKSQ